MTSAPQGIVFDIQRFSLHDGPGIRTTVFLKGCSLRCFWCHNPESIQPRPEIQFVPEKCIGCGECLDLCSQAARSLANNTGVYDRQQCTTCGACVEACFAGAIVLIGQEMDVAQVMAQVRPDLPFYETSDGGVTLSGGEPVLQRQFAQAILVACQAEDIHTAIETAGNYLWDDLAALLPYIDLVMMDLKHLDPTAHRAATGVTNERILANARQLAQTDKPIAFRMPVIPSVNDTPAAVSAVANFVRELTDSRRAPEGDQTGAPITLELLMFHRLAENKYRGLALDYRANQLTPLTEDRMIELAAIVRDHGVTTQGKY